MHTVLVIAGGASPEREVSLRSGEAVQRALSAAGHSVHLYDPIVDNLPTAARDYDVAFPVLHGVGGEDGAIQRQLEAVGLPYVGSNVAASELCFDKARYKQRLVEQGLPTPAAALISSSTELTENPLITQPFVLKPYDGGSSIDTFIVRDPSTANFVIIEEALARYDAMLLEELIEGIEITVAVLGEKGLSVIEIIPPASGEFDYENKYNGASQELCPPRHVSESTQVRAQELATRIHQLCGCNDYSRTDMILRPSGELMVLETNTLPGMTDQSLFPKAAKAAGLSMPQLCDRLVQLALSRQTDSI